MVSGVGFSLTCPDRLLRLPSGLYVHMYSKASHLGVQESKSKEKKKDLVQENRFGSPFGFGSPNGFGSI